MQGRDKISQMPVALRRIVAEMLVDSQPYEAIREALQAAGAEEAEMPSDGSFRTYKETEEYMYVNRSAFASSLVKVAGKGVAERADEVDAILKEAALLVIWRRLKDDSLDLEAQLQVLDRLQVLRTKELRADKLELDDRRLRDREAHRPFDDVIRAMNAGSRACAVRVRKRADDDRPLDATESAMYDELLVGAHRTLAASNATLHKHRRAEPTVDSEADVGVNGGKRELIGFYFGILWAGESELVTTAGFGGGAVDVGLAGGVTALQLIQDRGAVCVFARQEVGEHRADVVGAQQGDLVPVELPLPKEEEHGDEDHGHVVVPGSPAADLVVAHAGVLFRVLELAFDPVALGVDLPQAQQWRVGAFIAQGVAQVAVQVAPQQQPDFADVGGFAVPGPDAAGVQVDDKGTLGAVAQVVPLPVLGGETGDIVGGTERGLIGAALAGLAPRPGRLLRYRWLRVLQVDPLVASDADDILQPHVVQSVARREAGSVQGVRHHVGEACAQSYLVADDRLRQLDLRPGHAPVFRDARPVAAGRVSDPFIGQEQPHIDQGAGIAGTQRGVHRHLAVGRLPPATAVLVRHAYRASALLGKGRLVDEQRGDGHAAQQRVHLSCHLIEDRPFIPRRAGDEVLQRLVVRLRDDLLHPLHVPPLRLHQATQIMSRDVRAVMCPCLEHVPKLPADLREFLRQGRERPRLLSDSIIDLSSLHVDSINAYPQNTARKPKGQQKYQSRTPFTPVSPDLPPHRQAKGMSDRPQSIRPGRDASPRRPPPTAAPAPFPRKPQETPGNRRKPRETT